MSDTEQRAVHRVPFIISMQLHIKHEDIPSLLLDISLMGALIKLQTPQDIPLNNFCDIELNLGTGVSINLTGRVIRKTSDQKTIGVIWEEMDIDSAAHLKRLLELNLGDHRLIEQDIEAMYAIHEQSKSSPH